jgi:hypothetical protein
MIGEGIGFTVSFSTAANTGRIGTGENLAVGPRTWRGRAFTVNDPG